MSIRTLCVADDATREILRHLVAQMPQCEVVAWLHPSEAQVAVAAMKPDIILVAPELTATMHEPMQPYSRSMLPTALPHGQEPSFLKQGVVALPMVDGIELFACESIVQVKGEGSYVRFVFTYRNELVLAKTLADCMHALPTQQFMRVHRSTIVNVNHIRRMYRGKTLRLRMSNGDEVDVSDRYRDELMERLPSPVRSRPWR